MWVPAPADGVYVTEQRELLESPAIGSSEHVVLPKSPLSVAPLENVTIPPGLPFVPTSVSSTVAEQMLA